MKWSEPNVGDLVTCETVAAVALHVRQVTDRRGVKLGGHPHPKPVALCGCRIDWDRKAPVEAATCKSCVEYMRKDPP